MPYTASTPTGIAWPVFPVADLTSLGTPRPLPDPRPPYRQCSHSPVTALTHRVTELNISGLSSYQPCFSLTVEGRLLSAIPRPCGSGPG